MGLSEQRFIKLKASDIEIGKPVRWAIYNGNREQIIAPGGIVATAADAEALIAQGVYRVPGGDAGAPLVEELAAGGQPARAVRELGFDTSRIRVGDVIQLETEPDAPRHLVLLVGYLKQRGIIVTPPESAGGLMMLREGQPFVARFFSGQRAFVFSTTLLKQTSVPFPHLYLAYPRELRFQEIRNSVRADVQLIAAVEYPGRSEQASAKLINLSTTGAGLRSRQRLAADGDVLRLKFKLSLHGLDTFVVVTGKVCTVTTKNDESEMPFSYGIQFDEPDSQTHFSLAAFVYGSLLGEV